MQQAGAFAALGVVYITKSYINFYIEARIPEICSFNEMAQRLKSELSSSLKVRLRCAYHHRSNYILVGLHLMMRNIIM